MLVWLPFAAMLLAVGAAESGPLDLCSLFHLTPKTMYYNFEMQPTSANYSSCRMRLHYAEVPVPFIWWDWAINVTSLVRPLLPEELPCRNEEWHPICIPWLDQRTLPTYHWKLTIKRLGSKRYSYSGELSVECLGFHMGKTSGEAVGSCRLDGPLDTVSQSVDATWKIWQKYRRGYPGIQDG